MRLITFRAGGEARLGAELARHVIDLPAAHEAGRRAGNIPTPPVSFPFPEDMLSLLGAGDRALEAARRTTAFAATSGRLDELKRLGAAHPIEGVEFLPPIPRPGKIVCLGHNYRQHVAEMGGKLPEYPVLFARFANSLIGHRQPIVLPSVSTMVDYEAELAIVIGRSGKNIRRDAAFDHVAGYTAFNDVSVRDYQRRTTQWLPGKIFDGTGPLGPALVTPDDIGDPQALDITLRLNGQVMQHSSTSDFIFDIPAIITHLSEMMTLEPGDIISTGTPSGVGVARTPPVFLKRGDLVQVVIGGIGCLENPVI